MYLAFLILYSKYYDRIQRTVRYMYLNFHHLITHSQMYKQLPLASIDIKPQPGVSGL